MRRILHFTSPREHYMADAAVVWCFDHRFESVLRKLLKRVGIFAYDLIRVAGGAKLLVSPEQESDRLFILDQIRKSIKLHHTKTIVLMLHSDCGAYGGLAAFKQDAKKEAERHNSELQRAVALLNEKIPELTVKAYFVDFDGIWEIERADAQEKGSALTSAEA